MFYVHLFANIILFRRRICTSRYGWIAGIVALLPWDEYWVQISR